MAGVSVPLCDLFFSSSIHTTPSTLAETQFFTKAADVESSKFDTYHAAGIWPTIAQIFPAFSVSWRRLLRNLIGVLNLDRGGALPDSSIRPSRYHTDLSIGTRSAVRLTVLLDRTILFSARHHTKARAIPFRSLPLTVELLQTCGPSAWSYCRTAQIIHYLAATLTFNHTL